MLKKEIILAQVKEHVSSRINDAEIAMEAAQNSANEDTKSSAGDKFETSRAMAMIDRNLYARQKHEAELDMNVLHTILADNIAEVVSLGSLVKTNIGLFYMSISLGMLVVEGQKIMVTAIQSPMGEAIKGLKKGESVAFRGQKISILDLT